ncbi:MAG TPA: hypothetical protein VGG29_08295 [Caulobacteraceae bacterium]
MGRLHDSREGGAKRYLNKLRRMPSARFSGADDLSAEIMGRTAELVEALDIAAFADLLSLAENNALVAAKVALSVCRRVVRLYEFFLQGRANFDIPTSEA